MSNWWANKLGTPQAPVQPQVPQVPQQPAYRAPSYTPPPPMVNPELEGHVIPESAYSGRCPNCSSGNYGKTTPEAKARCYDCGYPIQQSGSGLGRGISIPGASGGPSTPAKQVSTSNNFNPGTIIGRI